MTDIRILRTPEDFSRYDAWVKGHPHGSLWQSLEWKQYQEALGREIRIYITEAPHPNPLPRGEGILASTLVVIDRTRGGWSMWDIPRGPLFVPRSSFLVDTFLTRIVSDAMQQRCLSIFFSPPKDLPTTMHKQRSTRNEQPSATRMIDLTQTEDAILAQMHPKGRYNIKVSQKHGVRVEESRDIEVFYGLLTETAQRDRFRVLPLKAYKTFLERLPGSFLLLAYGPPPLSPLPRRPGEGEFPSPPEGGGVRGGGKPIAGLIGVIWGQTGTYYYGASSSAHRALMAPYALQWEAMRRCRRKGCTGYDFLGVAPAGERGTCHPWTGVSAFKEKFGGIVVTYPPEQQIVLRPVLWKALQWKRKLIG